jgi:aarF domain-containing kinase
MHPYSFRYIILLCFATLNLTVANKILYTKTVIAKSSKSEAPRRRRQRIALGRSIVRPIVGTVNFISKPIRDANFWTRAIRIYSSYKLIQLRNALNKPFSPSSADLTLNDANDANVPNTNELFDRAHEVNSKRMIDLCLRLRGFYLKTGQFLGTRHDFMPRHYTDRLSKLHDDVPPMPNKDVKKIIESELNGPIDKFFTSIDLSKPIGAASIAQVHVGTWRQTGEKVAIKIQYPHAKRLMTGDLKNLRALAEFLQKTEFKFDMLSSIKELQKQIVNEFNFPLEAQNMDFMKQALSKSVPEVIVPRSIVATEKVLVMSYVEGDNLCRLAEFKDQGRNVPTWVKERIGRQILDTLAKVWGEMIFEMRFFNADPHPGNICLGKRIGVLDWGQMKSVSDDAAVKFSHMILAIHSGNQDRINSAFTNLGIIMTNPDDKRGVEMMALSMLDTRKIPGFSMDPFGDDGPLKGNTISQMPSDLYFLVRTVQLMRGISFAFELDYSLASKWAPYARRVISENKATTSF